MASDTDNDRDDEHPVLGMAAAVGAFLAFSVMNVFAKLLADQHSVIEIAFYRNVIASLPFLAVVFLGGRRDILIIRSKPGVIVFRAVLGTLTLAITFAAYALMPMAETAALLFTASLFIPVLGVIFLRERVGPWRWSAVLVGFIGVYIMLDPEGGLTTVGLTVALTAALLQAIMSVLLRHLGGFERPETVSMYFFLIGTAMTALAMPFVARMPTMDELPLFIGVGLAGAAAQWLYTVAMKHTPAAVVAIFNYSSIVWATLFGWLIWNEWPASVVLLGAAVVIASNILIIWRERTLFRSRNPHVRVRL